MTAASSNHPARRIRSLDNWSVQGWKFKIYGINPDTSLQQVDLIPAPMLDGARGILENVVKSHPAAHHSEQAGFVILHKGNIGNWLLINWWADQILLFSHLFQSDARDIGLFKPPPESLLACVWELQVVEFERNAWSKTMLRNQDKPDIEAYFEERLNEDW